MTQSLSIRPSAMRGRFAAALAVAVAAAVLVPLAQPAAATTASVVSVTADFDRIYEGGTAVFTFAADPPPAQDLVVTYEVGESQYHHDSLTDAQTGKHTVTIPANQASVAVEITVRPDTYYAWAGSDEAWGQEYPSISGVALGKIVDDKYGGRYSGHYCKNNGSGLPWREEPPSGEGDHEGDTTSPFHPDNPRFVGRFKYGRDTLNEKTGDAIPDVKQGDRQCGKYDFNSVYDQGEVRVKITSVSAGGRKANKPPVVFTRVVDRSLWTDKLDIVHTSGSTSVAENGGTDTYSVALTGKPSSNVTVTVRSHKPEAATVQTTGPAGTTATLDFTPTNWNTRQTVTVTGVDDSVVNSNGSRNAVISHTAASSDANYQGATESLTAKVTDDDAANVAIDLSTDLTSISEDAGARIVTVTATVANSLTFDAAKTVAVSIAGSGSGGVVGFTLSSNTFNIAIGAGASSATGTFTLTPTDNNIENSDEAVTVSGTLAGVTVNSAVIGLVDDETALVPRVSISVDHTTIKEKGTPNEARVTVSINKAPAQDIQIGYTVSSDSAVQDVDFVGFDDDIEFDGGTSTLTSLQFVTALNDTLPSEGPETVTVTLADGAGYRLGAQRSVTVTIDDNTQAPAQPVVEFTRATPMDLGSGSDRPEDFNTGDTTCPGGCDPEDVWVRLDPVPAANVALNYSLSGTATLNSDYSISGVTSTSVTIDVPARTRSFKIPVSIVDDAAVESDETVVLTLTSGTGYTLGSTSVHTITITDDDSGGSGGSAGVTISKSKVTVAEAAGTATYTVVLDSQPASSVTVRAAISTVGGGIAARVDADATPSFATTQDLTFTTSDWNLPQTVTVKGADDSVQNAGGKRTVTISHTVTTGDGTGYPTNLSIDNVTVDVTDDDAAPAAVPSASFGSASYSGGEASGSRSVSVGVSLSSAAPSGGLSLAYSVGGSATSGSDFTALSGTVAVAAGSTSATVAVTITDDSVDDDAETIVLTLTSGSGYTLGVPKATTVTIADDDAAPAVVPSASFGSASYSGGEASGSRSVSVGVSLSSAAPSGGLSLAYSVGGSATSGSDFTALSGTVAVAGGSTSAAVAVTITDDSVDDDAETIVLTLTSGSGYTLGVPKATTITIADDDPAPRSDQNPGNTGNQDPGNTSNQNPGDTGNQNPGNSSPGNTSPGSSSSASAAPAAPPVVELTLGVATPSSIALGESSLMTVELERAITRWVRVFVEIDSTAVLGDDYTVDANWGVGWVSLGSNPRRLVFDLPPNDTDAVVRVNSLDASAPDSSVTLSLTIGDRTFAASSVVTIRPVGEAEIVSVGDPEAPVSDGDAGDESDGADGQDDDGDDDSDAGDGSDDADQSDESDGADDQDGDGETAETEDSDEDDKAVDDDGHLVDPESLGTVTSTGDGWYVLYTVKPGDTLSGIALTFYRDDRRWRQIFAANQGRRQSDGYTFTSPNMIRAGWVLRVPLPIVAPSNATAAESNYVIYRVRSGDMLSSVGRRVYGDSAFYNRIVLANRGRRQANGQTFVHGDRIAAGWLLRIPVGG